MQSGLLYETGHKKRQLQPLGPSFVIMGGGGNRQEVINNLVLHPISSFLGASPTNNLRMSRKHFWEYFTS